MARVKVDIPKTEPLFKTQIPLTINFINYGGHMGNDAILTLCQEARIRFLAESDFDELNFFGHSFIQADAAICYKSEGFRGDILSIDIFITDISEHGFDFVYKFSNEKTSKEVARAKTGMVFFDYDKRKIAKCPESFLAKYNS